MAIDLKRAELSEMERLGEVKEIPCVRCSHPKAAHEVFPGDAGCYQTFACACLGYQTPEAPPCEPFSASAPFPLEESDFEDDERIDALAGAIQRVDWKGILTED